jgi:hypothetical protein
MGPTYVTWFTWLCLLGILLFFLYRMKCMRKIRRRFPFFFYFTFLTFLYFAYPFSFSWSSVGFSSIFLYAAQSLLLITFQFLDPGIITSDNFKVAQLLWPYDSRVYHEKTCRHTGLPSPARSKYSSRLRRRIARFSHFSPFFGNAVGIGNHSFFLILEFVTSFSSLICSFRSLTLLIRIARSALPLSNPGMPFIDGFYILAIDHTACFVIFGIFAILAIFQSITFIGDCLCIDCNQMPEEQVKFDLLSNGKNPYDRGRFENWKETFLPMFPPRNDRPIKSALLQKMV